MNVSITDLATNPATITISTYEGPLTVSVDTALRLANGTTSPVSPSTVLLINNDSGTVVTLTDGCTVSGSKVNQIIRGTELAAGFNYLLIVKFGDGAGNTQASFTAIHCPL